MTHRLLAPFARHKMLVACICTILAIVIVSCLVAYRERLHQSEARAAQAQEGLTRILALQNRLAEAEHESSRYLITGQSRHRKTFQEAARELDRFFPGLGERRPDFPGAPARLEELQSLVQTRLTILRRLMDIRQRQGLAVAELGAVEAEGQAIYDRLARIVQAIEEDAEKIAATEGAATKTKIRRWVWAFSLGIIFICAMVLFVLYLFYQEVKERRRAEDKLMDYQERLRSLASELTLAEERERRRIAVLLHDQIGQKLAVSYIRLGQLNGPAAPPARESLKANIDEIRQVIKQAIQDTKSLTFRISSPILYELGLAAAVEWLTEELQEQHGVVTYFDDDREPKPLDEDVQVLLFQAVSELLVNVVKHSRARHVQVSLWREEDRLHLAVYDDGLGFDPTAIRARWGRRRGGFGLFSIRERLRPFGGVLEVDSKPGFGTQVIIIVPLMTAPQGEEEKR